MYFANNDRNEEKAVSYLARAAFHGCCRSENWLAIRYLTGQGVEKDESRAYWLFRSASRRGDPSGVSEANVGHCYLNGHGVRADEREAANWYSKAAAKGEKESKYNYGLALVDGWAGETDKTRGWRLIREAAEEGLEEAAEVLRKFQGEQSNNSLQTDQPPAGG